MYIYISIFIYTIYIYTLYTYCIYIYIYTHCIFNIAPICIYYIRYIYIYIYDISPGWMASWLENGSVRRPGFWIRLVPSVAPGFLLRVHRAVRSAWAGSFREKKSRRKPKTGVKWAPGWSPVTLVKGNKAMAWLKLNFPVLTGKFSPKMKVVFWFGSFVGGIQDYFFHTFQPIPIPTRRRGLHWLLAFSWQGWGGSCEVPRGSRRIGALRSGARHPWASWSAGFRAASRATNWDLEWWCRTVDVQIGFHLLLESEGKCVCMWIHTYTYVHIYIYIERERLPFV